MREKENGKSSELAIIKNELSAMPGVILTPVSVKFSPDASAIEVENFGNKLIILKRAMPFFLGDYINYVNDNGGELILGGNWMVSEYKSRTLRNIAYVCRKVPETRRRDDLSFGHHQVVAPLSPEDQEVFLYNAALERTNRAALRKQVKKHILREKEAKSDVYDNTVVFDATGEAHTYRSVIKYCNEHFPELIRRSGALSRNNCKILCATDEDIKNQLIKGRQTLTPEESEFEKLARELVIILRYLLSEHYC